MQYNIEKDVYPIAIHCVIDDGGDGLTHSHSTICVVDHHTSDGEYHLRAMKQKIFVDGLCYLLQEIYGIENKNLTRPTNDDDEDNGSECVICICEPRDTLILPCRHLCLCNSCADSLRYQANNCPICRAPFRALLQIRAVQKSNTPIINMNPQDSTENIPMGYMPIPLIEALNGPGYKRNSIDRKDTMQSIEILNKDNDQKVSPANSIKRNSKEKINGLTEQFRMSVLLSNEENSDLLSKRSPTVTRSASKEKKSVSRSSSNRDRDCVKYINEKSASNVSWGSKFLHWILKIHDLTFLGLGRRQRGWKVIAIADKRRKIGRFESESEHGRFRWWHRRCKLWESCRWKLKFMFTGQRNNDGGSWD